MAEFRLQSFIDVADRIQDKASKEGRLISNPSDEELRSIAEKEPGVKTTVYGSLVVERTYVPSCDVHEEQCRF